MSGELEQAVREMMATYDSKEWHKIGAMFTDNPQTVGELSPRGWMRGREAMGAYFRDIGPRLNDIHTDLTDASELIVGDMGVITMWVTQEYRLDGEQHSYSGPLTVVLQRQDGRWLVHLLHAVPMPRAD